MSGTPTAARRLARFVVGLALEKLVFERLERFTVVRWGMLAR